MEKYLIDNYTEDNYFTGETEQIELYGVDTNFGYFEIETRDTGINGVVTIQAANWNIETLETIYKNLDETDNYELYLDNSGSYAYIDITIWSYPDEIQKVVNWLVEFLEKWEG